MRLDGYHMIIEHRTRDKHQNADSLSKKTEFYERLEEKQANQLKIKDGFSFLDKETYDKLPLTRWSDKSGHPIPGHPDLPVETATEIKVLARGEPVPLDLLVRSNLVQQELTRLGINSIALLNRTVNVAPDVMGKLRDLLDREVNRHDREWMETMQRLTVTEKTEKRPVSIRSRGVERDCRSIVNQLVSSMPKEVLLRTSFTEHGTPPSIRPKPLKKSGSSRDLASRGKCISRMQEKNTSRARIVRPGTRQCLGSPIPPRPSRTTCPRSLTPLSPYRTTFPGRGCLDN